MEARRKIEERLWGYLDGVVSYPEKLAIEKLLASDPQWQMVYQELKDFEANLKQSIELEHPPLRFSKNVMDHISALQISPSTKSYVNKKIVYGVGLFFLGLFIAALAYVVPGMDFPSNTDIGTRKIPGIQFNWSSLTKGPLFQAFLMIDAVLGLYLLDRYLMSRKKVSGNQQTIRS